MSLKRNMNQFVEADGIVVAEVLGIEVGSADDEDEAADFAFFDDFEDFIKWNLMILGQHMVPFYRTYDELKQETHARDEMEILWPNSQVL